MTVTEELRAHAEEAYRAFSSRLCASRYPMLGVRIPVLRRIARRLAHDPRALLSAPHDSFEQVMVTGLAIAYAKTDEDARIAMLEDFIPLIDNWSVCDSVAATLKTLRRTPDRAFAVCAQWAQSNEPYRVRFGIVVALMNLLQTDVGRTLAVASGATCPDRTVRMARAWTYATALAHDADLTLRHLSLAPPDPETAALTVSKARDSYRVSEEQVAALKQILNR